MKKKLTILTLISLVTFGLVAVKLINSQVKAAEIETSGQITENTEIEEFTFETKDSSADGLVEKVAPLSQEEYDDLIRSLPKGAKLADDIEVLPGVVK